MVDHVQSDDFKEKLATKINKKIDIPFVSEEKEQVFFEKCVDLVTDVIEGLDANDEIKIIGADTSDLTFAYGSAHE
mgnify:CR=1 FL=1